VHYLNNWPRVYHYRADIKSGTRPPTGQSACYRNTRLYFEKQAERLVKW